MNNVTNKNSQADTEIIKLFYPRDNNDNVVNFVLQEDPNLALDFTSIEIGFQVSIPKTQIPDNGLASKLFMNMNVEINSQLITSTKSVYVLIDHKID
jgi:hypothetical protein